MLIPYTNKHGNVKAVFTELQIMRLGLQGKLQTPEIGYRRVIPIMQGGSQHPDWLAIQEAKKRLGIEIKIQQQGCTRSYWPLTDDMRIIKQANNN